MRFTDYQLFNRLGLFGVRIFDGLGLVEDNVLPVVAMEPFVLLHHRVGRDHEIEFVQLMGFLRLHTVGIVPCRMSRIERKVRRELQDLARPVGDQRGGDHEKARALLPPVLQQVEQGQDLHGLAEPHVIGKAHAEIERVQKGEPAHAFYLIGPQLRLEGRGHGDRADQLRAAHLRHDRFKPFSAGHRHDRFGPGDLQERPGVQLKPERIAECKPLAPDQCARFFVGIEGLAQLFRVHRHPAVLDQREPFCRFEQSPGLLKGYRRVLKKQPHIETEQGLHPNAGRPAVADGYAHLQFCRSAFPPVRDAAENARLFVQGDLLKKGICLFCRPGQVMEQLSALQKPCKEGALFGGALNGCQKLVQLRTAFAIFGQRMLQPVPVRPAFFVQRCRVGGEKFEGMSILFALDEVEEHASCQVHVGAVLSDELLDRPLVLLDLAAELVVEPLPEIVQHRTAQILGAGHQGNSRKRMLPLLVAERNRDLMPDGFEVRDVPELVGEKAAETAQKMERRGEVDGGVAEPQKKKSPVRIFRETPEYLPLQQALALIEGLARLEPLEPHRADGHDDRLQFLVRGCSLAMFIDLVHSGTLPSSLLTRQKTLSLYKTQGFLFHLNAFWRLSLCQPLLQPRTFLLGAVVRAVAADRHIGTAGRETI